MELDPIIWGPHYWFMLHTIALNYPIRPNDVIKKKILWPNTKSTISTTTQSLQRNAGRIITSIPDFPLPWLAQIIRPMDTFYTQ